MKLGIYPILALVLFVPVLSQAKSEPSIEQQILPLLNKQMLAANAHDTDAFLATYSHDVSLVFAVNGEVIRGFENLREQQLKWWNNGKSDVVYSEPAPPEFLRLGSETVLVTQQLASHRTLPDGKPSDGRFAITSIWQRLPAGWRVIYCHESWMR
ncbi:MAG TPA: nuclear transport factor 2 family protein [Terracidiphilus sp.]|jgi:ketosteroid isomerase-like protein